MVGWWAGDELEVEVHGEKLLGPVQRPLNTLSVSCAYIVSHSLCDVFSSSFTSISPVAIMTEINSSAGSLSFLLLP